MAAEGATLAKCALCLKDLEKQTTFKSIRNDKVYHEKCFKCANCGEILVGLEHKLIKDTPFCTFHPNEECKPIEVFICKKCGEDVKNEPPVKWKSHPYHSECLKCFKCGQVFPDRKAYAENDQPHCQQCVLDIRQVPCVKCGKKIQDKILKLPFGDCCQSCFKCKNCRQVINSKEYFELEDDHYCVKCQSVYTQRRNKLRQMGVGV